MVRVDERSVHDAARAVIPVRAVQALMAHALDSFIATVADDGVGLSTASGEASDDLCLQRVGLGNWHKGMPGVVAMTILGEAVLAEVIVRAILAVDKFSVEELLDAAVACTDAGAERQRMVEEDTAHCPHCLTKRRGWSADVVGLGLGPRFWRQALCCAIDDHTVLDGTLDQPVVRSLACDTPVDTVLAKVEVAIVTGGAMVVSIRNGAVATVAADAVVDTANGAGHMDGAGHREGAAVYIPIRIPEYRHVQSNKQLFPRCR
jgi:hypothetical protein